jgi:FkbM family methyltransferase
VTLALAHRWRTLQALPVPVGSGVVFLDLRNDSAHRYFAAAPCTATVFEPHPMEAFRKLVRPGDTVYDIGANLGWYTVMCSDVVGPGGEIHAFEPQPALGELLRRTVGALPNARLHPFALSNESGIVDFHVPADHTMGSLRDWITPGAPGAPIETVRCEARRLDDFVSGGLRLPDVIKIDVEGAEWLVFDGARTVLDRPDAPVVFMEACASSAAAFGRSQWDAVNLLLSFGSANWNVRHLAPDGRWNAGLPAPEVRFATLLAVPAARLDRLVVEPRTETA